MDTFPINLGKSRFYRGDGTGRNTLTVTVTDTNGSAFNLTSLGTTWTAVAYYVGDPSQQITLTVNTTQATAGVIAFSMSAANSTNMPGDMRLVVTVTGGATSPLTVFRATLEADGTLTNPGGGAPSLTVRLLASGAPRVDVTGLGIGAISVNDAFIGTQVSTPGTATRNAVDSVLQSQIAFAMIFGWPILWVAGSGWPARTTKPSWWTGSVCWIAKDTTIAAGSVTLPPAGIVTGDQVMIRTTLAAS